jgi:hypothetical protein
MHALGANGLNWDEGEVKMNGSEGERSLSED